MKRLFFISTFIFLFYFPNILIAQQDEKSDEASILNDVNNAATPCISNPIYKLIEENCNRNLKLFRRNDIRNNSSATVQLNWPLQAGGGLIDCSFYYISAHVDQDTNATTFSDYNCGTITYDGHKGTDIAIGPFPFHKMDSDQVKVIAAAPGTIIDKHDGEFDRNCVGVGSGLTANYIVIEHLDGSHALYWHMKKNSLTAKTIGQSVNGGDFLGIVGSSGSSSGPHLHFEVWSGSTTSTYNDPFSGTCNHLNANSWWAAQKPYTEPEVLKASTHTTDVVIPACPGTETLNESSSFTIPFQGPGLAPGYAKFYIFMRNETNGTSVNMSILNPNSSVYLSWTRNCTSTYKFSYYGFSKLLPTQPGTYTFEATYNNITCSQTFDIVTSAGIEDDENYFSGSKTFPNPIYNEGIIQFNSMLQNARVEIYDSFGRLVKTMCGIYGKEILLKRGNLSSGLYFVRVIQENQVKSNGKFEII